jgi:hypothetical protein
MQDEMVARGACMIEVIERSACEDKQGWREGGTSGGATTPNDSLALEKD